MSVTESVKANKEHIKSYRQSSLIHGNVLAFVFRSIDLQSISSSPSTKEAEIVSKPEQLMQAFIDANKNSLNRKLVESFNELKIFGWYSSYTLLLSGPSEDIEVLKKAWSQRILRNPKGFLLKDVGTVKDFVVEWVPHSQFISLTTALHDTVMELDRDGRCASRDAIVKYLKNVYQDVRIPSDDIIHKCLGRLIEQRMIYHDGVGYRALIDNSPVHQAKNPEKNCGECEGMPVKLPSKNSGRSKNNNGSVGSSSLASKDLRCRSSRKATLSDGSSKEERASRPHSDEDRTRFNLQPLDNFIDSTIVTMKSGTPKGKKKLSPLVTSCGRSAVYSENSEEQDIKIIDISERRSVLRPMCSPADMKDRQDATTLSLGSRNGDLFQTSGNSKDKVPGRPYEKHCRETKPTKRSKPQRSRSFTDPSKHRSRSRSFKVSENDGDFPLRRVMGTEELRIISKSDLTEDRNGIGCISDKCKQRKEDKHKNDKSSHRQRLSSAKDTLLGEGTIPENGSYINSDDKRENSSASTVSAKSNKLTTDSDTPSGTYASDASSPFQSKRRKDLFEMFSEKNNNFENGVTYLCLTGKMGGSEGTVRESRLKTASDITREKFNVNIQDDSIFDYVANESDGIDYHCGNGIELDSSNLDSLTFGYSV